MGLAGSLLFSLAFVTPTQAQLVTVPTSCNVVVAGTGGVTGFGGKVGDGGIVTMPEPSGLGNVFTLGGVTPIKWTLLSPAFIRYVWRSTDKWNNAAR